MRKLGFIIHDIIFISSFFIVFNSCSTDRADKNSFVENKTCTKSERDIEEERIDSIIQDRKTTFFNKSIFAGIYFGDSKKLVVQKLNEYKKKFGDAIYIDSCSYSIEKISYKFYKNKLHTLEVTFVSSIDSREIQSLFLPKYGETDWYYQQWEYQNVIIEHEVHEKYREYDNKGYAGKQMYWLPSGGLTDTQAYYSTLTYKNVDIINEEIEDNRILREREQQKQDSIRYQLELKKKESAKKKADEQFENV